MKTHLQIRGIALPINLGWQAYEREHEQLVLLDLDLSFDETPKACSTDDLKDTVCYDALIKNLRDELKAKSFHLIEHLSYEIYQIVKSHLPAKTKINVSLTKQPKIEGLMGDVCFRCYD